MSRIAIFALAAVLFAGVLPARAESPAGLFLTSNPPIKKQEEAPFKFLDKSPVQYRSGKLMLKAYSTEIPTASNGRGDSIKAEIFLSIRGNKTIMPELRVTF